MERILVPLDGSADSERILPAMQALVTPPSAEIALLSVLAPAPALHAEPDFSVHYGAGYTQAQEDAERYLRAIADRLSARGWAVCTLVRPGPATEAILDAAGELGASLIAMATHGRRGWARFFLSSVAEQVLRRAEVPVFLVRMAGAPPEPSYGRILVPVADMESLGILPALLPVARMKRSEVVLVHIVNESGRDDRPFPYDAFDRAEDALRRAKIDHRRVVRKGETAAAAIRAVGRDEHAGMIAMATHGRRGWARWMDGSVAEDVLRDVCVPMLVARARTPAVAREALRPAAAA
jgi:nucleotide-binding universal stress UspA family protein